MSNFYNSAGDAVNVVVYCNTQHGDTPTMMEACEKANFKNTPDFMKEGVKLRCPVCLHEVVAVSTE